MKPIALFFDSIFPQSVAEVAVVVLKHCEFETECFMKLYDNSDLRLRLKLSNYSC